MSPTRSLVAAGGLTALVLVAVLAVGIRQGAFGLSADQAAVALPTESIAPTQVMTAPAAATDSGQAAYWDDDDDDEDDVDGEDDDDRPSRLGTDGERSSGRATSRADRDDD